MDYFSISDNQVVEYDLDLLQEDIKQEPQSDEKLICEFCKLDFPKMSDLLKHTTEFHQKSLKKVITCEDCDKVFANQAKLLSHKLKSHQNEASKESTG